MPRFDNHSNFFMSDGIWGEVSFYPWEPYKSVSIGKSLWLQESGKWVAYSSIYFFKEYYYDYYTGFEGLFPGKAFNLSVSTDQSRSNYIIVFTNGGDFIEYQKDYFGAYLMTGSAVHIQPFTNLGLDFEGIFMRKYFDRIDGEKDEDIFIPSWRLSYAINPSVFLRIFNQGSGSSSEATWSDDWTTGIFREMNVDLNMLLEMNYDGLKFLLGWNHGYDGQGNDSDYVGVKMIYSMKY